MLKPKFSLIRVPFIYKRLANRTSTRGRQISITDEEILARTVQNNKWALRVQVPRHLIESIGKRKFTKIVTADTYEEALLEAMPYIDEAWQIIHDAEGEREVRFAFTVNIPGKPEHITDIERRVKLALRDICGGIEIKTQVCRIMQDA